MLDDLGRQTDGNNLLQCLTITLRRRRDVTEAQEPKSFEPQADQFELTDSGGLIIRRKDVARAVERAIKAPSAHGPSRPALRHT